MASHTNSQQERIEIGVARGLPEFAGTPILVMYDDAPSKARASMLLDDGTISWLIKELERLR